MEADLRGGEDGGLVGVEKLPALVRAQAGGLGGAVDDLVGDAHHGVQVADVLPFALAQQSGGQGKRRRIRVDDLRGGLARHPVVCRNEALADAAALALHRTSFLMTGSSPRSILHRRVFAAAFPSETSRDRAPYNIGASPR